MTCSQQFQKYTHMTFMKNIGPLIGHKLKKVVGKVGSLLCYINPGHNLSCQTSSGPSYRGGGADDYWM